MNPTTAYSRRVFIRQGALLASFAATLPHFLQESAMGMLLPEGSAAGSQPGVPDERMGEVGQSFRRMLTEPAAREAFGAFMEKRKPDFTKI